MLPRPLALVVAVSVGLSLGLVAACGSKGGGRDAGASGASSEPRTDDAEARLARDYPWHALVRAKQLRLKERPDRRSEDVGYIRRGTRIRAKPEVHRGPGCSEGWFELPPRGFACRGTDLLVGESPPEPDFPMPAPVVEGPLPYDYFFVARAFSPAFHRVPTDAELASTLAYARRVRFFTEEEPERLARFLAGELRHEPTKPEVLFELLPRGSYVSSPHEERAADARWVRTVQGRVMIATHLEARRGSGFEGFRIAAATDLPIVLVNRPAQLLVVSRDDAGHVTYAEDPERAVTRYQRITEYGGRQRLGDFVVHRIGADRYLKEWFVSVIDRVTPDFEVGPDEAWIHVDLSEQTLVLYRGTTPVFGTLVSTGAPGHETPVGHFRIERKFVGMTMDDVGEEGGSDAYRIEDVPHTQYFRDSVAIHGAFWHDRFGTPRSHGCVNASPRDAAFLFDATSPPLPQGWHGLPSEHAPEAATRVWVTR